MIFHHIGFLTFNIKNSLSEFKMLSYKKDKKLFVDNVFNVKIQFITLNKNIIELIEPNKYRLNENAQK